MGGPRTVKQFLAALRSAGHSGLPKFHSDWVRASSVAVDSTVCREHLFLLEVLHKLFEYDQFDPSSLGGVELLVRRIFQLETAVDCYPRQPGSDGPVAPVAASDELPGSSIGPRMAHSISELRESDAFDLEQRRLSEEKTNLAFKI